MKLTYSAKALIRLDKKKSDGTCPIYFFVRVGTIVTKIPSTKCIDPALWDTKNNCPKLTGKDGKLLSKFLKDKINGFDTFMLTEEAMGKPITTSIANSYFNASCDINLFQFWENQVALWEHKYAPNTIKSYNCALKILKEFNSKITFGDLTPLLIDKFDEFLSVKRGNALNGRFAKHKCFKSIINQAIRNKHLKENPYEFFQIKSTPGNRKFLSIEEVKHLMNVDIPENTPSLYRVRDLFLFSCFTGLRFSDVMGLRVEHVKLDRDLPRLEFTVAKTHRPLVIPISGDALRLINRYTDLRNKLQLKKLVFPTIANPTINRGLKDLMKVAGVEKSISFHCARHTFACNHIQIGTSIVHVKDLLGHMNLTQTQIYAKSMESDLFSSMEKLNQMYS